MQHLFPYCVHIWRVCCSTAPDPLLCAYMERVCCIPDPRLFLRHVEGQRLGLDGEHDARLLQGEGIAKHFLGCIHYLTYLACEEIFTVLCMYVGMVPDQLTAHRTGHLVTLYYDVIPRGARTISRTSGDVSRGDCPCSRRAGLLDHT